LFERTLAFRKAQLVQNCKKNGLFSYPIVSGQQDNKRLRPIVTWTPLRAETALKPETINTTTKIVVRDMEKILETSEVLPLSAQLLWCAMSSTST